MARTMGTTGFAGVSAFTLALVSSAVGCGQAGAPAPTDDTAAGTGELRKGVCRSTADCGPNLHCTTDDGVCNPPPNCGKGTCAAVCYGTCEPIEPPPEGGPCASASDCRTFADLCTGCDCRSLSICEQDPVCPGPGVQCFVDPCAGQQAFCNAGHCALRSAPALCQDGACGPELGLPNVLCPDGKTVAGPSGRCLQNADGTCGWEIISCPDPSICGGGSPCAPDLEWCALNGRCTNPACLSCCMFGTGCTTAADCGGPACVTCPSSATACSQPICGGELPGQCQFPPPVCP